MTKPKLSLNRNKSKREKNMAMDRLHIIDRISSSIHGADDRSDFSDAKSIKGSRTRNQMPSYYSIDHDNYGHRKSDMVSRNLIPPIHRTFGSEEDSQVDDFAQYSNSDSIDDEIDEYLNKANKLIRKKALNPSYRYKASKSPNLEPIYTPTIPKVRPAKRDLSQGLKKINKKVDPKFKLAKVDIEEIQSSQTLQLGKWNREPSVNFVVDMMKQERRREYWKRRIKKPNADHPNVKIATINKI